MIISKTPLRLEFVGGSTDMSNFYNLYDGHVLNVTIDKYIYVFVNQTPKMEYKVITDEGVTVSKNPQDIKNKIIRAAVVNLGIKPGVEITVVSDIDSAGSGLGSSSSLAVGLINALSALNGDILTKVELAEKACALEIEILKSPIGKQDQYAAAFGGLSLYTFEKEGHVLVSPVNMSESLINNLNDCLLVFSTGLSHSSSNILEQQNKKFEENFLKLKAMGDLALPARHMLEDGDFESFAKIIEMEWKIKRGLSSDISNKTINNIFSEISTLGVWGGRVSGAGGGGYLYFFAPKQLVQNVTNLVKNYTLFPVKFTKEGSRVIYF